MHISYKNYIYVYICIYIINTFIHTTYIYMFIISSCYSTIPLALVLIGKDGGLSTVCHSCRFTCQQRVLKTFPDPGYLRPKDGVV